MYYVFNIELNSLIIFQIKAILWLKYFKTYSGIINWLILPNKLWLVLLVVILVVVRWPQTYTIVQCRGCLIAYYVASFFSQCMLIINYIRSHMVIVKKKMFDRLQLGSVFLTCKLENMKTFRSTVKLNTSVLASQTIIASDLV